MPSKKTPKTPAELAHQLGLLYGAEAKLEARDEAARKKNEASSAHSAAVRRKKLLYDSTDNASLEAAKTARAANHDAASCTAEVAYTLDSVTGSLDTSKGFRVEARMTVTSLREKQFHALAAVDLSDGMADSLGAIRESVKNVSKSIHAHGNGGGMHLAKFSDGQEFEDIPGVSDKTCQTLIDTHYAGKPKAKARAASTATATEDPHSMKVGAKAALAGSVESVAVETSWENDMDLMAGVALYTRGKKREGFCYQEQKTPTIHDLGGQPCVDLVRFDPDSAQGKRARRPQVIKLDLANISHDVAYIVLYAACESAKKFTGVRGLGVAIKDTTHGDGKHTQVAAFDTSDFADKSTASMVLGMFKAVVDRRDTSKRIGWEFIKDGRAASKDLGLTWRLVSPTPPSHLEPLFLKHLQFHRSGEFTAQFVGASDDEIAERGRREQELHRFEPSKPGSKPGYTDLCQGVMKFLRGSCTPWAGMDSSLEHHVSIILYTCGSERVLPDMEAYTDMAGEIENLSLRGILVQLHFFGVGSSSPFDALLQKQMSSVSYNPAATVRFFQAGSDGAKLRDGTDTLVQGIRAKNTAASVRWPDGAPVANEQCTLKLKRGSETKPNWDFKSNTNIDVAGYRFLSASGLCAPKIFLARQRAGQEVQLEEKSVAVKVTNKFTHHKQQGKGDLERIIADTRARVETEASRKRRRAARFIENLSASVWYAVTLAPDMLDAATSIDTAGGWELETHLTVKVARATRVHYWAAADTSPGMGEDFAAVFKSLTLLAHEATKGHEVVVGKFGDNEAFTQIPVRGFQAQLRVKPPKNPDAVALVPGDVLPDTDYAGMGKHLMTFLARGAAAMDNTADHIIHVMLYTCGDKVLPPPSFYEDIHTLVETLQRRGVTVEFHLLGVGQTKSAPEKAFREAFVSLSSAPKDVGPWQYTATHTGTARGNGIVEETERVVGSHGLPATLVGRVAAPHNADNQSGIALLGNSGVPGVWEFHAAYMMETWSECLRYKSSTIKPRKLFVAEPEPETSTPRRASSFEDRDAFPERRLLGGEMQVHNVSFSASDEMWEAAEARKARQSAIYSGMGMPYKQTVGSFAKNQEWSDQKTFRQSIARGSTFGLADTVASGRVDAAEDQMARHGLGEVSQPHKWLHARQRVSMADVRDVHPVFQSALEHTKREQELAAQNERTAKERESLGFVRRPAPRRQSTDLCTLPVPSYQRPSSVASSIGSDGATTQWDENLRPTDPHSRATSASPAATLPPLEDDFKVRRRSLRNVTPSSRRNSDVIDDINMSMFDSTPALSARSVLDEDEDSEFTSPIVDVDADYNSDGASVANPASPSAASDVDHDVFVSYADRYKSSSEGEDGEDPDTDDEFGGFS